MTIRRPSRGNFGTRPARWCDLVAELAHEAEDAGWDGFFVWDHIGAGWPVTIADPWVLLSAVALRTTTLRLGPMVTPVARRRPWKLARETATLDRLSQGRLILGVGLGGGSEYSCFHEPGDDRDHAAMLDEGLEVLTKLWSGDPVDHRGKHYRVDGAVFRPPPAQRQVPIWVAGSWPLRRPFRRAARWQGAFPLGQNLGFDEQMTPAAMADCVRFVRAEQQGQPEQPFDVVHWGITAGTDVGADQALVAAYEAVGVTWWFENLNNQRGSVDEQRDRIRRGPPQLP